MPLGPLGYHTKSKFAAKVQKYRNTIFYIIFYIGVRVCPERVMSSLCVMGWGWEMLGNSSAAVVAAVAALAWLGGQFQLTKYGCYQETNIKTGQFGRDINKKFEVLGAIGAIWSPMVDFFRKLHFLKCKILHNFGHKRASHGSPWADMKWERSHTLHDAF